MSSFGLFLNPSFLFDNNVQKSQSTSSHNLFTNPETSSIPSDQKHLLWVWQFSEDGTKYEIRDKLAKFNLGVVLKTHDGTDWMSEFELD